jgi:hypothetical protein
MGLPPFTVAAFFAFLLSVFGFSVLTVAFLAEPLFLLVPILVTPLIDVWVKLSCRP